MIQIHKIQIQLYFLILKEDDFKGENFKSGYYLMKQAYMDMDITHTFMFDIGTCRMSEPVKMYR